MVGNETGRLGSETVMIRGVHFGAERAVEHRVCGLVVGGGIGFVWAGHVPGMFVL